MTRGCCASDTLIGSSHLKCTAHWEVGANHFKGRAPRFVATEHESRDFERALDNRHLVLVELEIDDLPQFRFLASQVAPHFAFELFLRKLPGFVHPGWTIELVPFTMPWPRIGLQRTCWNRDTKARTGFQGFQTIEIP